MQKNAASTLTRAIPVAWSKKLNRQVSKWNLSATNGRRQWLFPGVDTFSHMNNKQAAATAKDSSEEDNQKCKQIEEEERRRKKAGT